MVNSQWDARGFCVPEYLHFMFVGDLLPSHFWPADLKFITLMIFFYFAGTTTAATSAAPTAAPAGCKYQ